MARVRASGSSVPANSRAECIESRGMPTSIVAIPSRVAVSGPMVEPHGIAANLAQLPPLVARLPHADFLLDLVEYGGEVLSVVVHRSGAPCLPPAIAFLPCARAPFKHSFAMRSTGGWKGC